MFFVVTTGRSGSQTLARVLSQHPLCQCMHEPHPILIKLAAERCYGQIDEDELRMCLFNSYNPYEMFPHHIGLKLYGESDQKSSYLIPILAELGTSTKFIWLLRDGRKVVASTFSRGWYENSEVEHPRDMWAKYRLQGDLCGDVSSETWSNMSPFEKCCWYWSFTNRVIARDLKNLSASSWMLLRLEDLTPRLNEIFHFLDLPYYPIKVIRANKSPVPVYHVESWSEQERAAFDFWCGREMDLWYSGWREEEMEIQVSNNGYVRNRSLAVMLAVGSHLKWLSIKFARRAVPRV